MAGADKIVLIIDGKGGGIGRAIVETLRQAQLPGVQLIALGANAQATLRMLGAGADDAATGENAICHMAQRADVITGPVALLLANSMLGEITPAMACAIAQSPAHKVLLPMQRCGVSVVGCGDAPLKELVGQVPDAVRAALAVV